MVKEQPGVSIEDLIKRLKDVTEAVRVFPFVYVFLYIVAMALYLCANESVMTILDTLLYVSPVVVAQFLALSKILNLCRWHRAACAIPLLPQVPVLIDGLVVEFPEDVAVTHIVVTMSMFSLFLISAYKVFAYGRK